MMKYMHLPMAVLAAFGFRGFLVKIANYLGKPLNDEGFIILTLILAVAFEFYLAQGKRNKYVDVLFSIFAAIGFRTLFVFIGTFIPINFDTEIIWTLTLILGIIFEYNLCHQ